MFQMWLNQLCDINDEIELEKISPNIFWENNVTDKLLKVIIGYL